MISVRTLLVICAAIAYVYAEGQGCFSDKACAPNECCRSRAQVRGRRSATGICTRKGTLGSTCYRGGLTFVGTPRLRLDCPCDDGFQCNVIGPRNPPRGEEGVCGPE